MKLKTLVVDDEPAARRQLLRLLTAHTTHLELLTPAPSVQAARQRLEEERPDVVFLDIQLPGEGGFDLLDSLPDRQFQVVFTTGFNQYALQAFRVRATDYLLKPVKANELQATVDRVLETHHWIHQSKANARLYRAVLDQLLLPQQEANQVLTIRHQKGFQLVRFHEIVFMEADNSYTHFYLIDGSHITASRGIRYYEEAFTTPPFLRIHRSYLINLEHLKG
ncbi:MAG: LytR/AlgR family response regulator transcription factor, partial [Salibacteraceae bacterium]